MNPNPLNQAMKLLFRSSDKICIGNQFAVDVGLQPTEPMVEFFCINPLSDTLDYSKAADGAIIANKTISGRRADLNVSRFQNFLFEMDGTALVTQIEYIRSSGFPFATVTYSGSKSYHAILSLEVPLAAKPHTQEGVDEYKRVWKQLAHVFCTRLNQPLTLLDSATQNPSRLSRLPEAVRDNGKVQELAHLGSLCSPDQLAALLREAPELGKPKYVLRSSETAKNEEDMRLLMPVQLLEKFKYPKLWASATGAGNYQNFLRLILWLIDSTNADRQTITTFLEKNTFPYLLKTGYPLEKCYKPINDAFTMKGEK